MFGNDCGDRAAPTERAFEISDKNKTAHQEVRPPIKVRRPIKDRPCTGSADPKCCLRRAEAPTEPAFEISDKIKTAHQEVRPPISDRHRVKVRNRINDRFC